MKIIFLWVKDDSFYDTLHVTFDGRYDIQVEENEQKLHIKLSRRRGNALPQDFFSVADRRLRKLTDEDRSFVDSVSVVVGQNASGKTSIARYLELIRSNGNCENLGFDYVLIYENAKDEWVAQASKSGNRVDGEIAKSIENATGIKCSGARRAREDFLFIYYSPHYTTEDPFFHDDGAMFNVSTSSLMGYRQEADLGVLSLNADQEFATSHFIAQEHRRVLEFSQMCMSRNLGQELNIRLPKTVRIGCNLQAAYELKSWIESCVAALEMEINNAKTPEEKFESKRLNELAEIAKEVVGIAREVLQNDLVGKIEPKHPSNFILNIFCIYLLSYLHTIDFLNNKFDYIRSWYLKRLVRWAKEKIPLFLASEGEAPFAFYDSLLKCLEENITLNIPVVPGNIAETEVDIAPRKHLLKVFHWIVTECKKRPKDHQDIMCIEIDANDAGFMNVVGHLSQCHTKVDFLTFSFAPVLSSGEMSFVSMFSRLWYAISRLIVLPDGKKQKFLIVLDEVETTLHPDWQRKIVHWVVKFLQLLPGGNHFHVVFLTHSPILLSDVPLANVCIFDRHDGTDGVSLHVLKSFDGDKHMRLHDTFSANIFDLYHSSFFLQEGVVGKFAQDKIDALLKKLTPKFKTTRWGYQEKNRKQKRVKLTTEERILVSLIGDPFVAAYLRKRADALGLLNGATVADVED